MITAKQYILVWDQKFTHRAKGKLHIKNCEICSQKEEGAVLTCTLSSGRVAKDQIYILQFELSFMGSKKNFKTQTNLMNSQIM